jgi:Holliday junction resolvasome RuvABC endonuclease subunit
MIKNPSIQIYSDQNPNRQRVHDVYIYFANLIKENDIKTVVMEKLFFMEANKNNAERVYAVR